MMDFEKLIVYQKSKSFSNEIWERIIKKDLADKVLKDQLRRASTSITLNIAEGCSRFSKADRRNFYVIARGSAYECIAILDLLKNSEMIEQKLYDNFYSAGMEICKMLYGLEKTLK